MAVAEYFIVSLIKEVAKFCLILLKLGKILNFLFNFSKNWENSKSFKIFVLFLQTHKKFPKTNAFYNSLKFPYICVNFRKFSFGMGYFPAAFVADPINCSHFRINIQQAPLYPTFMLVEGPFQRFRNDFG